LGAILVAGVFWLGIIYGKGRSKSSTESDGFASKPELSADTEKKVNEVQEIGLSEVRHTELEATQKPVEMEGSRPGGVNPRDTETE
jgi:hypothetical protein